MGMVGMLGREKMMEICERAKEKESRERERERFLDEKDGSCLDGRNDLEKGYTYVSRGKDFRDALVKANTNAGPGRRSGWVWYYKIMYAVGLLLLCWWYGLSMGRPMMVEKRVAEGVPQFVMDYAPMVYLDTGEAYFPSDIPSQISNTHPEINYTTLRDAPSLTPDNLSNLNNFGNGGKDVYLTSNLDVTTSPNWLLGVVPDADGKTSGAISTAIIVVDKGNGLIDAFYMYFYAYNQGNTVLGQELGDHIGDWEHNMIRFQDGNPQAVWYSQHSNGQAFTYEAVEKIGVRPVSYSAKGSHANYATIGMHDHTIPNLNLPTGLIADYTSKGMLWDPSLSAFFYNYTITTVPATPITPIPPTTPSIPDFEADTAAYITPETLKPHPSVPPVNPEPGHSPSPPPSSSPAQGTFQGLNGAPESIMGFNGRWGDKQYAPGDQRQPEPFFGFWKYVDGPTGPGDKDLARRDVCPENGILCILRSVLGP